MALWVVALPFDGVPGERRTGVGVAYLRCVPAYANSFPAGLGGAFSHSEKWSCGCNNFICICICCRLWSTQGLSADPFNRRRPPFPAFQVFNDNTVGVIYRQEHSRPEQKWTEQSRHGPEGISLHSPHVWVLLDAVVHRDKNYDKNSAKTASKFFIEIK